MNKNFILKTDILDIIFEKRNKAYGAYDLRKFYPNRLKLALAFMLIISMTFSAFTLLPGKTKDLHGKTYEIPGPELKEVDVKPDEPVKPPPAEKPVAKDQAPANQKRFNRDIMVVPNDVKTDSITTLLPKDVIAVTNIVNPTPGPFLIVPEKTDPRPGTPPTVVEKITKTMPREINEVDILPSYPGGMDALRKFLEKNLQTPDELERGESVNVRVRFVVDHNGKLQSFVTVLNGGEPYNKEVVRVLQKMPDWIPGKAKGENVPVYFTIPVKFVMSD